MSVRGGAAREIVICPGSDEVAAEAALRFRDLAREAISRSGRFTVALSGGSTPARLYDALAAPPLRDEIDWASILFFWGDERCVPPDDPQSNYRLANQRLLSKVPVNPANIFRIRAELDPETATAEYSDLLNSALNDPAPRFDLVLLGMGPDGHTASLFPQTAALAISDRTVAANYVEKLKAWRITLTAEAINRARDVVFMVSGADKAAALKEVLEGEFRPADLPSQSIAPENGRLTWLIDEPAAKLLSNRGA